MISGDIIARKVAWFGESATKKDIDGEIAVLAGAAPAYDPAHGGVADVGKPGLWTGNLSVGLRQRMRPREDIPGRLAALRKTVALKVKVMKHVKRQRKRKGLTLRLKNRSGRPGLRPRSAPKPLSRWLGRAKEPLSDEEASSSDGVFPTGKVREDKDEAVDPQAAPRKLKVREAKSLKKGAVSGKKAKQADRGPFGIGHRVNFARDKSVSKSSDEDDEDSGSDFRAGPSNKSRQLQLQEYSEQRRVAWHHRGCCKGCKKP